MKIEKQAIEWVKEIVKTMKGKTKDYSGDSDNISEFGEYGVAMRMNDKSNRLTSLIQFKGEPNHESIDDTLNDMIGYAIIMKMIRSGRWTDWLKDCGLSEKFFIKKYTSDLVGYYLAKPKYTIREFLGLCFISDQMHAAIERLTDELTFMGRKKYCLFSQIRMRDIFKGLFSAKNRRRIIDDNNTRVCEIASAVFISDKECQDIEINDKMILGHIPCVWK